jgi:hypothetical protein
MTILCTTDFSPASEQAATAAAAIAHKLGEPLLLAHASGLAPGAGERKGLLERLSGEAARLRASGAQVDTALHIYNALNLRNVPRLAVAQWTCDPNIGQAALPELHGKVLLHAAPGRIQTAVQHGGKHADDEYGGK